MGKWNKGTIATTCQNLDKQRIPISGTERRSIQGDIPYYGANGQVGYIDEYLFDEPLILIAEDGGNFEQYETRPIAYRISGKSWVNNHAHILRALSAYSQDYIFYSLEHKNVLYYIAGGTRSKLTQKELLKIEIIYPEDIKEQEKIAQILTTIDETIGKTKAIIEKYKAIKEGLMQNLLANGIDDNGVIRSQKTHKYKDSPLGKIPVEWDAVPILRLGTVLGGSTPKTNDASNWGEAHVWITPNDLSNISGKHVFSSERKITDKGLNQATRQLLPPKSFIISCRAPVGYCAVVQVPFSHNQGCKSIIPNELIIGEYLYYSMVGKKESLERVSSGTTFLELPKKELERFLITVPREIKEQEAIVSRLNSIDSKIEIEMRNLSKYQAIKNGLMQDLLTHTVSVDSLLERSAENA